MAAPLLDARPFTPRQAVEAGVSRHRLRRAVATGAVRRVVTGAYVDAAAPDDLALRVAAVRLVVPPDAVVTGLAAAWLHGIDLLLPGPVGRPVPLEVSRPAGAAAVRRPGVAARTRTFADGDVVDLGGLRVASAARTVVDLARDLERPDGLAYLDAALRRGLATRAGLEAVVERLTGFAWVDQARGLVALADGRSESPGESWTRLRWYDAGLPPLELQVPVVERGREVARIDAALPGTGFALEYDGEAFHGPERQAHDLRRRRRLRERHGWDVLVVGKEAVLGRSHAFESAVAERTGLQPRIVPWQLRARLPLAHRRARERRGSPAGSAICA